YVQWFMSFAEHFKRILTPDGSFVLDLGGAYLPGYPTRTIYQFELLVRLCKELGFFLAQEFYHYNPSRLPAPAEWVNVRRIRVKDSVNVVWWLSKSENPKADNRRVLKPYSESMLHLLKNGYKAKLRPSGHDISTKFSKNNKGAIPPNLLELANTESNSLYLRKCREEGLKPHPARFPTDFASFFIKFLTDPEDIVMDPFAGSNSTGYAAETLGRRWVAIEMNESYLRGSRFRFDDQLNLFASVAK
ncbi:MAG: site-specific DNA-methyltransferase, partial [Chitinivibrionales bacterium]|nr:site-specific DNA-methyltransferase [Chitinivibrionales bacterium]MBD3356935.1 site-specific DNA-methyltransferase [Chitinivibrionales bacterium]